MTTYLCQLVQLPAAVCIKLPSDAAAVTKFKTAVFEACVELPASMASQAIVYDRTEISSLSMTCGSFLNLYKYNSNMPIKVACHDKLTIDCSSIDNKMELS